MFPIKPWLTGVITEKETGKKQSLWNLCLKKTVNPPFSKLKHCLERMRHTGIIYSFQEALEDLGFMDLSYYQDPTGIREANLWKLIYCLKEYESQGASSLLTGFTDWLFYEQSDTDPDQKGSSQNALSAIESAGIHLMTIHAAKGLEFKHIILIKTGAGLRQAEGFQYFASNKKKWALAVKSEEEDKRIKSLFHKKMREEQKKAEIQEFDRLLYVALTRAKETVTLIGSEKPEKYSWPERFPFFSQLKPGFHQTKKYTYSVKTV